MNNLTKIIIFCSRKTSSAKNTVIATANGVTPEAISVIADCFVGLRPPRNDEIVNELYIMNKGGYVYIMTNRAGTVLYTGVTSTIANRVCEHRTKAHPDGFTARYNCTKLVYYKKFATIEEAIAEEKRIKGGSRQRKIDLIQSINPTWQDLFAEVQRLGVGYPKAEEGMMQRKGNCQ